MKTCYTLNLFPCRLAPLLPADIQFIALDFPGHGKSSHRWPGMPYTHFEYVADVKKVVSQLGWERFSIIGHSMGASVGSLYAGAFPLEVKKLILFDYGEPPVIPSANKVLAHYATKMSEIKTTTPHAYQSLESAVERREMKCFPGNALCKEDAVLLTERGTRLTEKGIIFSHDPILKGLYVPFMESHSLLMSVLSNTQSAVLLLESTGHKIMSEEGKARRDRMKTIVYQNANCKVWKRIKGGHHFHMENPKQVAQEIIEFIALCKSQDQSVQSKL